MEFLSYSSYVHIGAIINEGYSKLKDNNVNEVEGTKIETHRAVGPLEIVRPPWRVMHSNNSMLVSACITIELYMSARVCVHVSLSLCVCP